MADVNYPCIHMAIPAGDLAGLIIPFPNAICVYVAYFFIMFALAGIFLNLVLFLANWGKAVTPNTLLILSLCISDSTLCLSTSTFLIGSLIKGGYFWGPTLCLLNCAINLSACCISALTVTSMALERYLTLCKGMVLATLH